MVEEVLNGSVVVDPAAVEPNEYFRVLKESIQNTAGEQLEKQLATIAEHLIRANKVGQQSFIDRLSFTYDVIVREQVLLANGFNKFVYQADAKKFLNDIKTVKVIELERYPRAIPPECLDVIHAAQQLKVFDEFAVIFTDLTDQDYKTPAEKNFVSRNRDPVVLGYFKHKSTGLKHDRFYFITDWEDPYCDLTFGKMLTKMTEAGIQNPGHEIGTDLTYVQELVRATLDKMDNTKKASFNVHDSISESRDNFERVSTSKGASFWERMTSWLSQT
jgi:hypothetical protein